MTRESILADDGVRLALATVAATGVAIFTLLQFVRPLIAVFGPLAALSGGILYARRNRQEKAETWQELADHPAIELDPDGDGQDLRARIRGRTISVTAPTYSLLGSGEDRSVRLEVPLSTTRYLDGFEVTAGPGRASRPDPRPDLRNETRQILSSLDQFGQLRVDDRIGVVVQELDEPVDDPESLIRNGTALAMIADDVEGWIVDRHAFAAGGARSRHSRREIQGRERTPPRPQVEDGTEATP